MALRFKRVHPPARGTQSFAKPAGGAYFSPETTTPPAPATASLLLLRAAPCPRLRVKCRAMLTSSRPRYRRQARGARPALSPAFSLRWRPNFSPDGSTAHLQSETLTRSGPVAHRWLHKGLSRHRIGQRAELCGASRRLSGWSARSNGEAFCLLAHAPSTQGPALQRKKCACQTASGSGGVGLVVAERNRCGGPGTSGNLQALAVLSSCTARRARRGVPCRRTRSRRVHSAA